MHVGRLDPRPVESRSWSMMAMIGALGQSAVLAAQLQLREL